MRIPPFNPYFAVTIGVLAISTTAIFVKLVSTTPATIIANFRLLFALIIMLPIVYLKFRHELALFNKKDWMFTFLAGVALAVHYALWFESLQYTSIASSTVLAIIYPVFLFLVLYIFAGERFSSGTLISIIITLFGSVIIGWGDHQVGKQLLYGDALALFAAFAMTVYLLFGQKTRNKVSLITYTFLVYMFGTVVLFIYNLLAQHSFIGYSFNDWWIFLVIAIIPTFLGHFLFNWAMKWGYSSTVSMAIVVEPFIAVILGYIIIHENITWSQALGGTIVLFGLFLFTLSNTRKTVVTIARRTDK